MGKISQVTNINSEIKYSNNNSNQTTYPNNNYNQTTSSNNNYNQTTSPNNHSIQINSTPYYYYNSGKSKYESAFKCYTAIMFIVTLLFGGDTIYKRDRNFNFFKQFIILRLIAIVIALLCIISLCIGLKKEKRLYVEPFKYLFFLYVCFNVIFIKNIVEIDEGDVSEVKSYIPYGCLSFLFYGSYYILSLLRIRNVMKKDDE